jgi:hypothetical protein
MQVLKYNNEIGSFVVKARQPLHVLKDVNCTDNAQQIFGGKTQNGLLFAMDRVIGFLFFFLSPLDDIAD